MLGLDISEVSDVIYIALAILLISVSNYLLQIHSAALPESEEGSGER